MLTDDVFHLHMKTDSYQITKLIDMDDPRCIRDEVKIIVSMIFPEFDFEQLDKVFGDVIRLFKGKLPGYKKCNTNYHDLKHTTDTILALARLIHGAFINKCYLSKRNVNLGLICALLHDTGYIQHVDDRTGTGAKYTRIHVERSIEFTNKYFEENGYSQRHMSDAGCILKCTGININTRDIEFESLQVELIGKILGTADLLGQMADRTYLEKLPLLFREFKEGKIEGYENELDLLKKTVEFYDRIQDRFEEQFGGVNKWSRDHFKERWNIDRDMYGETIDRHIQYVKMILENHRENCFLYLRRGKKEIYD